MNLELSLHSASLSQLEIHCTDLLQIYGFEGEQVKITSTNCFTECLWSIISISSSRYVLKKMTFGSYKYTYSNKIELANSLEVYS